MKRWSLLVVIGASGFGLAAAAYMALDSEAPVHVGAATRDGGTTVEVESSQLAAPYLHRAGPSITHAAEERASTVRPAAQRTGGSDLHLDGFLAFDQIATERIRRIVFEADSGNPRAQYSMAKLWDACRRMLVKYPDEGALADAVARISTLDGGRYAEGLQREVQACFDLRDASSDLSQTAEDWMQLAAKGGYGPALAAMAGAYAWGATSLDPESSHEFVVRSEFQKTLVAAAVRTRDPKALFAVSGFFGRHGPMNQGKLGEDLAWVYAACHFGLECGPENWMLQWMCRWGEDCDQAYAASLPAYLEYKQYSPAEQDYAARRAPELIRLLEAGDWDALDLELDGDPTVEEAIQWSADQHREAADELKELIKRGPPGEG